MVLKAKDEKRIPVTVVVGTRPEAIKMAPVALELKRRVRFAPHLLATGQHTDMLLEPLSFFGLKPDDFLGIMRERQTLDHITASVLVETGKIFDRIRPALVLVHGDTTTTFAASLAAFYRHIPVGHVEAGLRSGDLSRPFPEEANRIFADRIASMWFAPTTGARDNLLREGIPEERILVTGNTVIDALFETSSRVVHPGCEELLRIPEGKRMLLLTAHRRESWGEGLRRIAAAVCEILDAEKDLFCLVPMHRNPEVRSVLREILGGRPDVLLCDPLAYPDFIWSMRRSCLILSDSGGVQEESTALGKPVLVLRDVTERPEAVEMGTALLVGTERERIVRTALRLLRDESAVDALGRRGGNPFGDGRAARRIVDGIERFLCVTPEP